MRRLTPIAWSAAAALVPLAIVGRGFANYDTLYAIVWGRELAHGRLPDYGVPLAPTPHPLATFVGVLLAPLSSAGHGAAAETVVVAFAFLALGVVGYLVYRLGALWFGRAAGLLAAAIVLTREPVLSYGVRAYVDVPYLALVLAALLVEARRPRAGAPVLVLLGVAGLLRPEAWLLSAAYLVYLARARRMSGRELAGHVALVAAAPALWLLADLLVSGDALHSLTGTRDVARTLERKTGIGNVPVTLPRRIGEILREPVLVAAAGGGLLALAWLRRQVRLPAAVAALAVAAFAALAVAGLPIITRYAFLAATLLAIFAGAGAFGWTQLPRGDPRRRRWAAFGGLALVLLAVFLPAQVRRLGDLRDQIAIQSRIVDDLYALDEHDALGTRCGPIYVPNHRPVPLVALIAGVRPTRVRSAQLERPRSGQFVAAADASVARAFILDPRDPRRLEASVPPDFVRVGADRSWTLYERCATGAANIR